MKIILLHWGRFCTLDSLSKGFVNFLYYMFLHIIVFTTLLLEICTIVYLNAINNCWNFQLPAYLKFIILYRIRTSICLPHSFLRRRAHGSFFQTHFSCDIRICDILLNRAIVLFFIKFMGSWKSRFCIILPRGLLIRNFFGAWNGKNWMKQHYPRLGEKGRYFLKLY